MLRRLEVQFQVEVLFKTLRVGLTQVVEVLMVCSCGNHLYHSVVQVEVQQMLREVLVAMEVLVVVVAVEVLEPQAEQVEEVVMV
jgi:hypothetical protein